MSEHNLQTFDLIAFKGHSFESYIISAAQKFFYNTDICTHMGIVIKRNDNPEIMLLQSERNGTDIIPLEEFMSFYKNDNAKNEIYLYKLKDNPMGKRECESNSEYAERIIKIDEKLDKYLEKTLNKPFNYNLFSALKTLFPLMINPFIEDEGFTCSEYVINTYREFKIVPKDTEPQRYTPSSFIVVFKDLFKHKEDFI